MVSGVGHHGPGSGHHGKGFKMKGKDGGGMPPFLQEYLKDKGNGLPPGLAKMAENGKLPPGLAKMIEDGEPGSENLGDEIRKGVEELKKNISDGLDNLLGGLGLGGKTTDTKTAAVTQPTTTKTVATTQPVTTTRTLAGTPFTGSLTPQQQNTLKTADSVLAKATGGAGGGGSLINPNATGPVLAPSVLGGGSVGIIPRGTSDPTRIIDNGVLTSLRAGDTAGFIGALAGNIQQSQNSAAAQFFRLTS